MSCPKAIEGTAPRAGMAPNACGEVFNELRICYRVRQGGVRIATSAWFFQHGQGQGQVYQPTRYGELRVVSSDEALLLDGLDANLQRPNN